MTEIHSPLQTALDWWAARDSMGGFACAAAQLFPGWMPRRSCRAPHRTDASPSFSLYRNAAGAWRFKDHATGEQGGLVAFVMLAGMDGGLAARWLMERSDNGYLLPKPLNPSKSRVVSAPYRLSATEIQRCASMSATLAQDCTGSVSLAAARGWQPETIRALALDGSLGLHEGRLVMIYPTGAKKRLKPLEINTPSQSPPFLWMFGKPDSLWRGDCICDSTRRIHITEGETAAISLISDGIGDDPTETVVAVPGASCWREAWAEAFRGKSVTLWPDADAAGLRLQERIIASLTPFANSIETVTTTPK